MEKGFSEANYARPDYSSFYLGYCQDQLYTLVKMRGLIQSNINRGQKIIENSMLVDEK
jgi:hypothetical protein